MNRNRDITPWVMVVVIMIIRSNADLLKRRAKLFLENAWWVFIDGD